ncbi:serine/threonine protein kinase [Phycicoccus sp. MAQZ13P-2]|uniref:serine/threonine-protein kinase n=1 Tax=Phycicoccus mangrovi TaxID=2840470 RepID=UPI001C0011C9|nr:serine/threonine-protein kinase [Phycicoccus mangrovi]MBT9258035.1 serine/threonine protein kinase [Phycicoccus mangrovi]MBT9276019.1 serine/threonine protein kinase [Phycicoccus mangrovi]
MTGPVIADRVWVRTLGGGGFGDVHLYENRALGRSEAVKVLRASELSPEVVAQFLAEVKAMAGLEHPCVVPVYGMGHCVDGRPYLAMKVYGAGTMEDRARGGRLSLAEVLRAGIGVAGALETAHRAGLVHRDVKPANILVDAAGDIGLTDFGGAARTAAAADDPHDETVGVSPPWSPPEVLWSTSNGSVQSDVYSLGATLWHLLVGRAPFEVIGGDNSDRAVARRAREVPPPETGRGDVPPELDRLLREALAKDPARRPRSAGDLARGLLQVEKSLGLAPTRLVVLEPTGPGDPRGPVGDPPPDADGTDGTVRRPRRVAPPPRPTRPDLPSDSVGTALRPRRVATGDEGTGDPTRLRPRTSSVVIDEGGDPVATGGVRRLLVGAGVLLVVAAAAGAWALGSGGDGEGVPAARATVDAPGQVDALQGPAGPVKVSSDRRGGDVVFTWRYDGALSTDTYRLRVGGPGGSETTGDEPTLTVPAPTRGTVCLSVIVVRSDGSGATRDFPEPTCG